MLTLNKYICIVISIIRDNLEKPQFSRQLLNGFANLVSQLLLLVYYLSLIYLVFRRICLLLFSVFYCQKLRDRLTTYALP